MAEPEDEAEDEAEGVFEFERPLAPTQPKEPGNRVTVTETVYHQVSRHQPTCIDSRHTYEVKSDEQAYRREVTIGEDWTPLDLGWLKDAAGMIVVKNEEGRGLTRVPSDEQKAATAAKVLVLSFVEAGDCWLIHPGRSFRGFPSRPGKLFLRSQSGPIHCILFITPR